MLEQPYQTQIIEIDESSRTIASEDSGDGRWSKGDEVALVQDDFHPGSWGWACVKDNQQDDIPDADRFGDDGSYTDDYLNQQR